VLCHYKSYTGNCDLTTNRIQASVMSLQIAYRQLWSHYKSQVKRCPALKSFTSLWTQICSVHYIFYYHTTVWLQPLVVSLQVRCFTTVRLQHLLSHHKLPSALVISVVVHCSSLQSDFNTCDLICSLLSSLHFDFNTCSSLFSLESSFNTCYLICSPLLTTVWLQHLLSHL
jgi:hypothetical protein